MTPGALKAIMRLAKHFNTEAEFGASKATMARIAGLPNRSAWFRLRAALVRDGVLVVVDEGGKLDLPKYRWGKSPTLFTQECANKGEQGSGQGCEQGSNKSTTNNPNLTNSKLKQASSQQASLVRVREQEQGGEQGGANKVQQFELSPDGARLLARCMIEELFGRVREATSTPATGTAVPPVPLAVSPINYGGPIDSPAHNEPSEAFVRLARRIAEHANQNEAQSDYFVMQLRQYPADVSRRAMQQVLKMIAEGREFTKASTAYALALCGKNAGFEGGSWEEFEKFLKTVKRVWKKPQATGEVKPIELNVRQGLSAEEMRRLEEVSRQVDRELGR